MLALDDAALARLAIAATRIAPEQRQRWLRELADRVDPPRPRARSAAARRQAQLRANRKAGRHCFKLWISDRAIGGLILKCIQEQRLTPEQAIYPQHVKRAIVALLEEEGFAWSP